MRTAAPRYALFGTPMPKALYELFIGATPEDAMPSTTIRIDPEVYRLLLESKARLEIATGKPQSFSATVAFLLSQASSSSSA
jgi:hypothetical protein